MFCDGSEDLSTTVPKSVCEFNSEAAEVPLSHSTSQVEESISSRTIKLKKAGPSRALLFYLVF